MELTARVVGRLGESKQDARGVRQEEFVQRHFIKREIWCAGGAREVKRSLILLGARARGQVQEMSAVSPLALVSKRAILWLFCFALSVLGGRRRCMSLIKSSR
jgi:hypothetical protein